MFELLARADSIEERISTEEDVRIFWEAQHEPCVVCETNPRHKDYWVCKPCGVEMNPPTDEHWVDFDDDVESLSCEDCILIGDPECYGGGDYRQCGRGPF